MFKVLKRIYSLGYEYRTKINISILLQLFDSSLAFFQIGIAMMFFKDFLEGNLNNNTPLMYFGMLSLGVIVRILVRHEMDKTQYSTIYRIFTSERIRIANHVKMINMGYFSEDNVGKITSLLTNNISFIEEHGCISGLTFLSSSMTVIAISIMFAFINPTVALIYFITTLIAFIIFGIFNKNSIKFGQEYNKAGEILSSAIIEYVRNISVIKAFNLIKKHERSNEAIAHHRKIDIKGEVIAIPHILAVMIVSAIGTMGILYYILLESSNVPLYEVITILIFSLYAFNCLTVIATKVVLLNMAGDSLDLIDELLELNIIDSKGNEKPKNYDIEFKNVCFGYDQNQVLNNINFHLKENTMTALVGLSGSGKSTLVNLIPRFFDINSGEILIGDVSIKDMAPATLYNSIAMVFQDVYLFKDTIYNNIAFGNDSATKEMIEIACKKARCYDFIMSKPDGFDTIVGEGGSSLSGGERQRISIARAILKDAPIILLDEATASVDPDNESEIQEAINALVQNKTMLVIAHKLSCVKNANKILVLGSDGTIVQEGTHIELLKADGFYATLWQKRSNSKSWKISK